MNKTLMKILGIKEKVVEAPGVLGHYDSKPYHNFRYALKYAEETEILMTNEVEIFSRVYRGTTFVNILVNNETGIDVRNYSYDKLKSDLISKGVEATDRSIVVMLYQHKNDVTMALCKKFCTSDKHNFQQGMVYNPKDVQMDFYKPVPKFYKLYDHFCEDLYFDLGFIDHTKR